KIILKHTLIVAALLAMAINLNAQQRSSADSLLNAIEGPAKPERVVIFKATRLVNSQTTEMIKKQNFNFQIIHRFGDIAGKNGGGQTAFGLDRVNDVLFGFEYGVSDNFNIGLNRSTIGQLIQLELKYAVMHQTTDNSSPFALTFIGEAGARPYSVFQNFEDRVTWLAEAVIARKFSGLSLQVAPTFVRDNTPYPQLPGNEQQFFAIQTAARIKLTNHTGLLLDYAHPFSSFRTNNVNFEDPIGIGYEVETGGHVFTVNITNSNAIAEVNYLSNSQSRFSQGQYRIGFTISRMFDFRPKNKK
ncbi:MAG: DUF5777 family beta-barrel protein, partial [Mucilaginibacter sp.]